MWWLQSRGIAHMNVGMSEEKAESGMRIQLQEAGRRQVTAYARGRQCHAS